MGERPLELLFEAACGCNLRVDGGARKKKPGTCISTRTPAKLSLRNSLFPPSRNSGEKSRSSFSGTE